MRWNGGLAARCTRGLFGLALMAMALAAPAAAQDGATAGAPPPQVNELLELLADPGVQDWLTKQRIAAAPAPATEPTATEPESMPSHLVAGRLATIRQHLRALAAALPTLPAEIERAGIILQLEFQEHGLIRILLLVMGFVALGFGAEWLYYRVAAPLETWIIALPLDTARQRVRAIGVRLAYAIGMVASFALGSVGAFLLFDWPLLLKEILLGYLLAFLCLRLALVAGRFLLAPGGERFRILPMTTEAAWHWHRRLALAVGWFSFGWVTVGLLGTLGFAPDGRRVVAYSLGIGLLAIGLEAIWRAPGTRRRGTRWLLSIYFVLLWLLWVAGAMPTFWLLVVAVALPMAMSLAQRAVDHVLRPAADATGAAAMHGISAVSLARGLRALLIIAAVLVLAWAWDIDLVALTANDTLTTRLLRGVINAVVIILIADFAWRLIRAVIDRKISEAQNPDAQNPDAPGSDDARHRARLRTLLPILRNVLLTVIVVMAVLMALSALGIEIGPLIAGAGVVGVAIGFGAQTVVKDVISGMFYLLDAAFRVGEYIQSGSYKGTVESFSLRSVKLRHQRGPLFTVPFGELGAVQNMSRDWVIDKLTINVNYDADLDKAKKLIKEIGKELAQDPEFAPLIIEPLKMQGVDEFGDYGIKIRMKMMTKPGQNFTIRRRAYAMIKKAFDANGIEFARPTVQVAGGDEDDAAVARQAMIRQQAAEKPA